MEIMGNLQKGWFWSLKVFICTYNALSCLATLDSLGEAPFPGTFPDTSQIQQRGQGVVNHSCTIVRGQAATSITRIAYSGFRRILVFVALWSPNSELSVNLLWNAVQ